MGTGTARRLWALDGAPLTQERSDMLDGAAPGPVGLVVPTFLVEHDHDLFGDGAVTMLAMPGHTPGNTSLLVHLPGRSLVLTGDTAHLRGALTTRAPMSADTDRAQAGASLDRLVTLAQEHEAELWVTHDPDDWERYGALGEITASGTACASRGLRRR